MKNIIFLLTLALSMNAFAGTNSSDRVDNSGGSCELPPVDNIKLTGYGPGCSADAGDNQATPGGLTPNEFQLGGEKNKVVLAAAPMRMPACAKSKCYQFKGGVLDQDSNQKLYSALAQKTLYFDDLCPGCKVTTFKGKSGKMRTRGEKRIDISMSCKDARNFRAQRATLVPVKCTDEVMAEIGKSMTNTKLANKTAAKRGLASVQQSGAGR